MSLRDRAAAWWSAWKWVVILAIALAASGWVNVWQWKRAITAPLREQVASKDEALKTSAALLQDVQASTRRLLSAQDRVAGNLATAARSYEQAAAERPLAPNCAPGQHRMDSVNRALGAPETP